MDADERRRWGVPDPLYSGPAEPFEDLHPSEPGRMRWVKDGHGRGYWPDCCDKHRPKEIIEARQTETAKREAAEKALAAHRGRTYRAPEPDQVANAIGKFPVPPTVTEALEAQQQPPPPISAERAAVLYTRWAIDRLRRGRRTP